MALTKIKFEVQVEDTFQNGTTLDVATLTELLNRVAEDEYNRQFDSNMHQRRFGGMTVATDTTDGEPTLLLEEEDLTDPVIDVEPLQRRRAGTKPMPFDRVEAKLFLPR